MNNLRELEKRIEALEEDSHPPVAWQQRLDDLEFQIKSLKELLEKYGI
jgi:hypothetical protein